MKILFNLVIFILFISFAQKSFAGIYLSASALHTKTNDPIYKTLDSKISPALSLGFSKRIDNFVFGVATNRLLANSVNHKVSSKGSIFTSKTKTIYDSVQIGYLLKRTIPSFIIANTKVNKKLFYRNDFVGQTTNSTFVYAFNVNHFLSKNISTGITYILPNKELYLRYGVNIGLNYYF